MALLWKGFVTPQALYEVSLYHFEKKSSNFILARETEFLNAISSANVGYFQIWIFSKINTI